MQGVIKQERNIWKKFPFSSMNTKMHLKLFINHMVKNHRRNCWTCSRRKKEIISQLTNVRVREHSILLIISISVITEQNRKIEECLNSIAKFQGRIDGVQEGRSNLETESVKSLTLVQSKMEKEKRILESLNSRISEQTGKYPYSWKIVAFQIYFRNVRYDFKWHWRLIWAYGLW